MRKKPNILLITTDSQRWDSLACMGSSFALSPHLDRLAQEGVMFTQGHTSSPVCMAARCSLITGLHTPVHGCIENGVERRNDFPTLPDLLQANGYHNIMVGKAHFGPIPESFDVKHIVNEKMVNAADAYAEHLAAHGYQRVSSHPNPIPEHLFMEAFLVDRTIEEINNSKELDKPFFAYCSMVSPHEPIDPPGRWAELYKDVTLPEINAIEGEIDALPKQQQALLGFSPNGKEQSLRTKNSLDQLAEAKGTIYHEGLRDQVDELRKLYYGLAAYCDDQVGRLISYLDESGLREDTLILFSSDHGLQLYDHSFNDKHNYYDESWRVPFIMSMPGTLPMNETRDFAIWNDIPTTILGAASVVSETMQGFDLFTALKEGKPSPRKCAVASLFKSAALATHRWKLTYFFDEAEGQLFDRVYDPNERHNLYDNEDYASIKQQLLQALLTWRSDLTDVAYYHERTNETISRLDRLNIKAPVARRVIHEVRAMNGLDSEVRLNRFVSHMNE